VKTIWIEERQLTRALERNEAFWRGELMSLVFDSPRCP